MKWNKINKSTNSEGTTITYKCDALQGITHIPDANREGTGNPSPYVTVVIKGYQGGFGKDGRRMTREEIDCMKYKVCCPMCDNEKCVKGTDKCEAEIWAKEKEAEKEDKK